MNQPAPPFSVQFTPNVPELLSKLNCTIAISTYQAGKVIFLSPKNNEQLVQLPRTFHKAMGIALEGDRMAIATIDEIIYLKNNPQLARTYPKKQNTYDAFYMPRSTFYTGQVDVHDLHFGNGKLWAVNTSFSCVCNIDAEYSFTPVWKPSFITELASEDRCHLNGMAMENGQPRYVSALGSGNTAQSWRNNIVKGGIIIDLKTNEILTKGLAMPHSPRLYDGKLYTLLSASEQLIEIDRNTGAVREVMKLSGFVRGMAKHQDYLFIATSKLRKNSSTFKHLAIADRANQAGVTIVHLPSASIVGKINYKASVDEIYDVQVLPNIVRPNIANTITNVHKEGLITPQTTYWAVKRENT